MSVWAEPPRPWKVLQRCSALRPSASLLGSGRDWLRGPCFGVPRFWVPLFREELSESAPRLSSEVGKELTGGCFKEGVFIVGKGGCFAARSEHFALFLERSHPSAGLSPAMLAVALPFCSAVSGSGQTLLFPPRREAGTTVSPAVLRPISTDCEVGPITVPSFRSQLSPVRLTLPSAQSASEAWRRDPALVGADPRNGAPVCPGRPG